jgi:ATP-dependent helicase/DNAse subunit B
MTLPEFQIWLQEHVFSATDLENHQLCPYRFYASAYLKLRPSNPLEVELTPLEVGSLVHRVLERFLRAGIGGAKPFGILDEELQKCTAERPHLSKPLLAIQKKKIVRMLESFADDLEKERAQASEWKPTYFEWSFGQAAPPLVLKDTDGKPVSFRGRIDRIDVNESDKTFLVIDYKTGSTKISGNQIRNGEALQLPIYLLAVKGLLLKDYEPAGAVYYQLSDMSKKDGLLHAERLPNFLDVGPRSSSLVPASKWDGALETIEDKVGEIVSAIRKTPIDGFLSHSEPCEPFCPYQDICRMRSSP